MIKGLSIQCKIISLYKLCSGNVQKEGYRKDAGGVQEGYRRGKGGVQKGYRNRTIGAQDEYRKGIGGVQKGSKRVSEEQGGYTIFAVVVVEEVKQ